MRTEFWSLKPKRKNRLEDLGMEGMEC